MLRFWTDFAHDNIDNNTWPQFTESNLISYDFDIPSMLVYGYNQERCDFFDSIGYDW